MEQDPVVHEVIKHAEFRLKENTAKIKSCLEWLTEEEIWQKPNSSSNSVGNLVLHLCGNISQYIISALGGQEDKRERDLEFSIEGGLSKEALIKMLKNTIEESIEVLDKLDQESLLKKYNVQGFHYTGVGNVVHAVEHFSYHTGQIAFWTKVLKDRDLGFYGGLDLNKRNEK
ncbi:hypothetical protein GCM10028791_17480 [Echinicola sediminis]